MSEGLWVVPPRLRPITNRQIVFESLKHLAIVVLAVYFGLGTVLFLAQRSYMYLPSLGDGSCEALLETGAEKRIQGATTLYYRKGEETLVVFYHGNGGTACDRAFLAEAFAARGLSFLFVEYAGYSDERKTNMEEIFDDVKNTDDFLETLDVKRVVYMSESLGAGPLAHHTSLRAPDAIVLSAPYTSISDVAEAHFPYALYPSRYLVTDNFETSSLSEFDGESMMIHAIRDEVIPFALGMAVFESLSSGKKEMVAVREAGHNDVLVRPDILKKITDFALSGMRYSVVNFGNAPSVRVVVRLFVTVYSGVMCIDEIPLRIRCQNLLPGDTMPEWKSGGEIW